MNGFWIIGIIVNLLLTGLAIYWIMRQVKAGRGKTTSESDQQGPE